MCKFTTETAELQEGHEDGDTNKVEGNWGMHSSGVVEVCSPLFYWCVVSVFKVSGQIGVFTVI